MVIYFIVFIFYFVVFVIFVVNCFIKVQFGVFIFIIVVYFVVVVAILVVGKVCGFDVVKLFYCNFCCRWFFVF